MSLLELSRSHVTPGVLAQSCHSWCSCSVVSFLEILPCHVTPRALAQSCHSWSYIPVMSLLVHLPSHVTTVALAQSCHSWNTCPVVSLLELMPAKFKVRAAYCFCPVVPLLERLTRQDTSGGLPSRVTPGSLASKFLISSGVMLSPSCVTPAAAELTFRSWISCPVESLLEPLPTNF